jgi:5-methylcytosine-specific restriction protein A
MDKPFRQCAVTSCKKVTQDKYCEDHAHLTKEKQQRYNKSRGSAASQGYDGTWQKVRAMYLARHPLCEDCRGEGRVTRASLVHHVKELTKGGARLDGSNMRALCNDCHERIHGADRWKRRA